MLEKPSEYSALLKILYLIKISSAFCLLLLNSIFIIAVPQQNTDLSIMQKSIVVCKYAIFWLAKKALYIVFLQSAIRVVKLSHYNHCKKPNNPQLQYWLQQRHMYIKHTYMPSSLHSCKKGDRFTKARHQLQMGRGSHTQGPPKIENLYIQKCMYIKEMFIFHTEDWWGVGGGRNPSCCSSPSLQCIGNTNLCKHNKLPCHIFVHRHACMISKCQHLLWEKGVSLQLL